MSILCRDSECWVEGAKDVLSNDDDQLLLGWVLQLTFVIDAVHPQTWKNLERLARHRDYAIGIFTKNHQSIVVACSRKLQLSPTDIYPKLNQALDVHSKLDALEECFLALHQTEQWFKDCATKLSAIERVLEYLRTKPHLSRFHWRKLSLQIEELNPNRNQNERLLHLCRCCP